MLSGSTTSEAGLRGWAQLSEVDAYVHGPNPADLVPVAALMRREHRYRLLLALADAIAVVLALALLQTALGIRPNGLALAGPVLIVVIAKIQGLYDRDDRLIRKSTIGEWRKILQAASVLSILLAVPWAISTPDDRRAALWLFVFLTAAAAGLVVTGRTIARGVARRVTPDDRCLILGRMDVCGELISALSGLRGVQVVGTLAMRGNGWSRSELRQIIERHNAQRLVLVSEADWSGPGMVETIRAAKELGVRITIFPTVLASIGWSTTFDEVKGLPLFGVAPIGLSRSSRALKRAFDVALSAALLIVLAPLMIAITVWIRIDSPGPAMFRQIRIGRDGKPFRILKFRSMVVDAEQMKEGLREQNEAADGLFKIARDPRVTRIGGVLRRTHLDELPQLLNVLRGQMSLVGPRPLIIEEDVLFKGGDRCRLQLTPGVTGPWQVRGPMASPISEMAKLDYLYVSNWSLWSDMDILARTVGRVIAFGGH